MVQTICIVPHRTRTSAFFNAVYVDGLRVAHNGRLHSLLFSSVLSSAHDAVSRVKDDVAQAIRAGRDVILLVAAPTARDDREEVRHASQRGGCDGSDDASFVSGLTDSGAVVLELYMHLFHALFDVAEDDVRANLSIVTCTASNTAGVDIRDELRQRYVWHVDEAYSAPLQGPEGVEWGDVIRVLSQQYEAQRQDVRHDDVRRYVEEEGEEHDVAAAMACVVQMRLWCNLSSSSSTPPRRDGVTVTVIDAGGDAALLQCLCDTLSPHTLHAAAHRVGHVPARHPLSTLLEQNMTPKTAVRVIVVPDPNLTPHQSLRLLRLVSALKARRQGGDSDDSGDTVSTHPARNASQAALLDAKTPTPLQRHGKLRNVHVVSNGDNGTCLSERLHGPTPSHLVASTVALPDTASRCNASTNTPHPSREAASDDAWDDTPWHSPQPNDFLVMQGHSSAEGRVTREETAGPPWTQITDEGQPAVETRLRILQQRYAREHTARLAAEQKVAALLQMAQGQHIGATTVAGGHDTPARDLSGNTNITMSSRPPSATVMASATSPGMKRRSIIRGPAAVIECAGQAGDVRHHSSTESELQKAPSPCPDMVTLTSTLAALQQRNEELTRQLAEERQACVSLTRTYAPHPNQSNAQVEEEGRTTEATRNSLLGEKVNRTDTSQHIVTSGPLRQGFSGCAVVHILDGLIAGCASLRTRLHHLATLTQPDIDSSMLQQYGRALVALRRALVAIRARQSPALASLATCVGVADVECAACVLDFETRRCEQVTRFLPLFSQLAVAVDHLCLRAHPSLLDDTYA